MKPDKEEIEKEKGKFISSLFFPVLFVLVLWIIKLFEIQLQISFAKYGILPLTLEGTRGIFFTPFIHGSVEHLFNNTIPVLVLGTAIFYFYREVAYKVVLYSWILSGFWVWTMARESYHIGASGLIYAFVAFLFLSGILRKNKNLLAISMLVVFLYGNLIWWIFPVKEEISWEGHLMGGVAGILLAIYFRKYGPVKKQPEWMDEDDDDFNKDDTDQEDNDLYINYEIKK